MGIKSRMKKERALLAKSGDAHHKHRIKSGWAKVNSKRHHGIFSEQATMRRAFMVDGRAELRDVSIAAIRGLNEYNKQMQLRGFGTPPSHLAHRLVWADGIVVGFRHSKRPNREKRRLNRTLPRGKAVLRLIALERGSCA